MLQIDALINEDEEEKNEDDVGNGRPDFSGNHFGETDLIATKSKQFQIDSKSAQHFMVP